MYGSIYNYYSIHPQACKINIYVSYLKHLNSEVPEDRSDPLWDVIAALLLQVGQLLRVHAAWEGRLPKKQDTQVKLHAVTSRLLATTS